MDVTPLWTFDDPAASLERFAVARAEAAEPEASILATQQARALGLLGRFDEGHAVLDAITSADPEALVRRHLERGRLQRSGDSDDRGDAEFRAAAEAAAAQPDAAPFGGLRVDALHMLALLPTDTSEQVARTVAALAVADASADPTARAWRASLLNNLGMCHHDAGDDHAALRCFVQARDLRDQLGQRREEQIARYMVGWAQRLVGDTDAARATMTRLRADLVADGISDEYVAAELAALDAD